MRLEPPAAEDFLRTHTRTFLVTLRPDGAPTCHPMVGLWREGALWLNTYRKSAKVRNLTAEPRVACVVVTDDDEPRFRGVVLRGRAEVVPLEAAPAGRPDSGARAPGVGAEVTEHVRARLAEGKRVLVRIVPESVRLVGQHG
jgi:PPOX class probable F420-dependent enzyme